MLGFDTATNFPSDGSKRRNTASGRFKGDRLVQARRGRVDGVAGQGRQMDTLNLGIRLVVIWDSELKARESATGVGAYFSGIGGLEWKH
jgi:hypothetical protein